MTAVLAFVLAGVAIYGVLFVALILKGRRFRRAFPNIPWAR